MKKVHKAWMIAALAGSAVACTPVPERMDTPDPSMAPDSSMMADTMMTMPPDTPRVELR